VALCLYQFYLAVFKFIFEILDGFFSGFGVGVKTLG